MLKNVRNACTIKLPINMPNKNYRQRVSLYNFI
jgi:hypothetical protein